MEKLNRRSFAKLALGALVTVPAMLHAQTSPGKIKVLIITGQNNHDWQRTTSLVQQILEEPGIFEISVSTSPPQGSAVGDWETWLPDFTASDVVLSIYNGEMWPDRIKNNFTEYIEKGGNALILHSANNSFEGWLAFEKMVGLLWRNSFYGKRLYYDDDGKQVIVPPGEGPDAGHGKVHDWPITIRDSQHPVTKGIPKTWMHAHDELYHGQRGPAENMDVLATAYSSKESGGTGKHEPMIWWIPYGKGRVLTFLPGNLLPKQENDAALRCVGFRTMLQRSSEWLAKGTVSIPVPDNFPTETQTSLIAS